MSFGSIPDAVYEEVRNEYSSKCPKCGGTEFSVTVAPPKEEFVLDTKTSSTVYDNTPGDIGWGEVELVCCRKCGEEIGKKVFTYQYAHNSSSCVLILSSVDDDEANEQMKEVLLEPLQWRLEDKNEEVE